ncbi:MAG: hypothetical protein MPEBLZ_02516, partial [Candidatus Methanoperedens nitroreducens]
FWQKPQRAFEVRTDKRFMELNEPENNDLMRKLVSAIFVGFKKTSNEEHLAGLSAALNATGYKLTEKLG